MGIPGLWWVPLKLLKVTLEGKAGSGVSGGFGACLGCLGGVGLFFRLTWEEEGINISKDLKLQALKFNTFELERQLSIYGQYGLRKPCIAHLQRGMNNSQPWVMGRMQ